MGDLEELILTLAEMTPEQLDRFLFAAQDLIAQELSQDNPRKSQ